LLSNPLIKAEINNISHNPNLGETHNDLQNQSASQAENIAAKNWTEIGLEFLVEMAQKKEIDPWDVDLVYVIDKFLGQLTASNGSDNQQLKEAARIIFFVSVLLRIKSENLYIRPSAQEISDSDDFMDFDNVEFDELDPENRSRTSMQEMLTPKALDKILTRNTKSLKEQRNRRITLEDLITIFKQVEEKGAGKKRKKKLKLSDFEDEGDIVIREDEETDIMDLAHNENLEQKIQILSEYILQTLEMNKTMSLSLLKESIGDWVDTFLSALFLSHSGKTELMQEIFYDEILIKRIA
jgi:segregation and condensation protein A